MKFWQLKTMTNRARLMEDAIDKIRSRRETATATAPLKTHQHFGERITMTRARARARARAKEDVVEMGHNEDNEPTTST